MRLIALSQAFAIVLPFSQFAVAAPTTPRQASTSPRVDLGYAVYEGNSQASGVDSFLGMRFAAPPLGDLRFRAPQDPLQENGTVQAKERGPICLAVSGPSEVPLSLPSSEDCLFIDVYAPSSANESSNLPVMLWIQGGGLVELINADYDGTGLINASGPEGMVIVSFNYRVGPYGFLAGSDIQGDGDLNAGLLDQVKAMQWVSKHISKFGGDPNKVTIFGTSVGGGSVLLHYLSYGGSPPPYFRAGIASASYVPAIYTVDELEFQYQQLLNATNCTSLQCLRGLPTTQLQAANTARPWPGRQEVPLFGFYPVIDGKFLTNTSSSLLSQGKFARRPLITGTSDYEGTIFVPQANTSSEISAFIQTQLPLLTSSDTSRVNALYAPLFPANSTPAGVTTPQAPLFYRASAIYTDAQFICPGMSFVDRFAAAATAVNETDVPFYLFRDDILDPVEVAAGIVTPHTWEVEAVWGPEYSSDVVALPGADSYDEGKVNAAIVPVVQAYWTSFARTGGDPNAFKASGAPTWESVNSGACGATTRLRISTNNTAMETVPENQIQRCDLWYSMRDRTGQ